MRFFWLRYPISCPGQTSVLAQDPSRSPLHLSIGPSSDPSPALALASGPLLASSTCLIGVLVFSVSFCSSHHPAHALVATFWRLVLSNWPMRFAQPHCNVLHILFTATRLEDVQRYQQFGAVPPASRQYCRLLARQNRNKRIVRVANKTRI